jgi:hypothetical protein
MAYHHGTVWLRRIFFIEIVHPSTTISQLEKLDGVGLTVMVLVLKSL